MQGDGAEAIEILQRQIRNIELKTGKNVQASALEAHHDLADDVSNDRLSYPRALEVANSRAQQEAYRQQLQAQQNQQYQLQQANEQLNNSVQSVESLEAKWRATDPDFSAIQPHILAAVPEIQAQFHPSQWPAQINMLYQATKRAMASQVRQTQSFQPLRGNGNAGSKYIPKTTSEAAMQALGFEMD